jgi:hypothetical protein
LTHRSQRYPASIIRPISNAARLPLGVMSVLDAILEVARGYVQVFLSINHFEESADQVGFRIVQIIVTYLKIRICFKNG